MDISDRKVYNTDKEMKTNYKLIATDLDGTLLRTDSSVSEENINAINRLAEAGIKTAVLTGRTLYEIPLELRSCKGIEYFVYSNGAGINHSIKGILDYRPIEKVVAIRICEILKSYCAFTELYTNGYPMVEKDEFNYESLEYYNIDKNFIPEMVKTRRPVKSLEKILYDNSYKIEMLDIFFKYDNERTEFKNRLMSEFYGLDITTSMDNNLEIMNKGINKGFGLKRLCELAGVNIEDAIVIGDSKNDITAFNAAKTKYAVSNACDELKKLSDKIICSNGENIMEYFEKELL